jgi:hypothetical protein
LKKTEVLLENVKYIPELKVNLFSLTAALQKGAKLHTERTDLILEKGGKEILFNKRIPMGTSLLMATRVEIQQDNALILSEKRQMSIEKMHRMLGHASLEITQKTAKRLGIKLVGQFKSCENCMLAKIKRKNINK